MQNISGKESSLSNFCVFLIDTSYSFFSHTEFFYYRPKKTRLNWILLWFFHHQQNSHLHSDCKYFIIHDKSERPLTIFKTSIKFQDLQCEGDGWCVWVGWNPLDLSLKNMSKFHSRDRKNPYRATL